jgi:hypothetical protein
MKDFISIKVQYTNPESGRMTYTGNCITLVDAEETQKTFANNWYKRDSNKSYNKYVPICANFLNEATDDDEEIDEIDD